MMKFSRIGATALALALSVTFLTPSTVSAANEKNYDAEYEVGLGNVRTSTYYDDDLVSVDNKKIAEYATKAEAEKAFADAGYKEDDGYSVKNWVKGGKDVWVIIQKIYKNEITGKTASKEEEVVDKYASEVQFDKTINIKKGEVTLLRVSLINGDTAIKKVKSSKKKVVTAALDKKNTSKMETNENVSYYMLEKDNDGNYFYYTSLGTKVIIPKDKEGDPDTSSNEYKNSNASSASVGIKLTAKKPGKAKLSFDVYNKNGTKTGTASITVVVQSDDDVFKTFSYGGKSLIMKNYGDSNYINDGREVGGSDNNFTDKKKGKLVIKANNGIKIVKIEIGKLSKKSFNGVVNDDDGTYENIDDDFETRTASGKSTYHPVDLNGDGDFLDTIYGISEKNGEAFTYKKFKSGKTLKLSTVGVSSTGKSSISYKKYVKNANDELVYFNSTGTSQSNLAPTVIRVTYYDKENKSYRVTTKTLYTTAKNSKK
ncbi:hypothetical protein [Butyrivibrio sp. JL13D10]|uniref:hypothetical protein n=1 Tax=Butyrivibrio sp. JL13D10 TaxID=3236815 RepID=UPI0038B55C27